MDSLVRDKAEFLQAACGYASALCHCTLVLISGVKLLQMNLLLLLPLGCVSLRLSQSGEERCGAVLNAILSNFYLPCTVHSKTAETYALWCVSSFTSLPPQIIHNKHPGCNPPSKDIS